MGRHVRDLNLVFEIENTRLAEVSLANPIRMPLLTLTVPNGLISAKLPAASQECFSTVMFGIRHEEGLITAEPDGICL